MLYNSRMIKSIPEFTDTVSRYTTEVVLGERRDFIGRVVSEWRIERKRRDGRETQTTVRITLIGDDEAGKRGVIFCGPAAPTIARKLIAEAEEKGLLS